MMLKNKLVLHHDSSIVAIEGDVGIVSSLVTLPEHVDIHKHPLQFQLTIDAVEWILPIKDSFVIPFGFFLPSLIWPYELRKKKKKESQDFVSRKLTPKGPRGVFLQTRSKSAISNSRSSNEIFFTFFHFQL
jgi:hypothetical protein